MDPLVSHRGGFEPGAPKEPGRAANGAALVRRKSRQGFQGPGGVKQSNGLASPRFGSRGGL